MTTRREMTVSQQSLARRLWETGAIMDRTRSPDGRGFRLKLHEKNPEAPLSPFYLNLRTPENPKPGPLTPDVMARIGWEFERLGQTKMLRGTWIAGVPNAGNPIADAFVAELGTQSRVMRLMKEEGAAGRRVVGIVGNRHEPGDLVLLVDDLITRADSKCEATSVLREAGLTVGDCIVLVDREQGGASELEMVAGVRLHTVFTAHQLFDFYFAAGLMDDAVHAEVVRYLAT